MPGPNFGNLRALAGMLPSVVKQHEDKRVAHGGVSVHKAQPTKSCKVCTKMFDFKVVVSDSPIELGVCELCQAKLDDGYTAFVSVYDTKQFFAFAKNPAMADKAGHMMMLSIPVFLKAFPDMRDQIEGEIDEIKTKPEAHADEVRNVIVLPPKPDDQPPAA